jgi:hypothetical protein
MRTSGPRTWDLWGVILGLVFVLIAIGVVIVFASSSKHFPVGGIIGPLVWFWISTRRQHDYSQSRQYAPSWQSRPTPSPDTQARSHPLWDRWLDG